MNFMTRKIWLVLLSVGMIVAISCNKDSEDPATNPSTSKEGQSFEISGSVSKGSFVAGSSLTFFELDDELKQTGRSFSTSINDDLGNYELLASGIAESFTRVTGDGFYWDEVANENTQNRISLVALSKFNSSVNVNILTHMEADRVRYLYTEEGLTFDQAKEQALNEILEAFDISPPIKLKNAEEFNFSKGDETSKILLVISAVIQGRRSVAEVSVLLSELALEFKNNGSITDTELIAELAGHLKFLDKEELIRNVFNKYSEAYPNLTEESFRSSYLDSIKKPNGKFLVDLDLDGVTDDIDQCPNTPADNPVNSFGCAGSQVDTDEDGVNDDLDQCQSTPVGETVDSSGCSDSQKDSDNDGVTDDLDLCPGTLSGTGVNTQGCSASQTDTDEDGVTDDFDQCQNTPVGETVDSSGCSDSQKDSDTDGVTDDLDLCPETLSGAGVNTQGCSASQTDTDEDGVTDDIDQCPSTPMGEAADGQGCSASQRDTDDDGVLDSLDQCPGTLQGSTVNWSGCDDYIFKDENGITIKAKDYARVNDRKIIDGKEYVVVDDYRLRQMVDSGEDLTSAVTTFVLSMDGLFRNKADFNLDISNWDVSNVTNMMDMFNGATMFNQPIGVWNVSSVQNMQGMFQNAHSFNQPIGSWDVSNVELMQIMFSNAYAFNQPIDSWNVSKVTGLEGMFGNATAFNQPLNSWNTQSVTSMGWMFFGAESFNQDLSNWDTSSVYLMDSMFMNARQFNQNLTSWCVTIIRNEPSSFSSGSSLQEANKPIWGSCPGG
jgi:surface protein